MLDTILFFVQSAVDSTVLNLCVVLRLLVAAQIETPQEIKLSKERKLELLEVLTRADHFEVKRRRCCCARFATIVVCEFCCIFLRVESELGSARHYISSTVLFRLSLQRFIGKKDQNARRFGVEGGEATIAAMRVSNYCFAMLVNRGSNISAAVMRRSERVRCL